MNPIQSPLSRPIDIMTEEKRLYGSLLSLADQKKDALVKNDIALIDGITGNEGAVLDELKGLDTKKSKALEALNMGGASLPEVMASVQDAAQKAALEALRLEFKQIVTELGARNELNKRLLETHLQYTALHLELLTREQRAGDFYGSTGYVDENISTVRKGIIDRKV